MYLSSLSFLVKIIYYEDFTRVEERTYILVVELLNAILYQIFRRFQFTTNLIVTEKERVYEVKTWRYVYTSVNKKTYQILFFMSTFWLTCTFLFIPSYTKSRIVVL